MLQIVKTRFQRSTHAPVAETPPLPDNFVDDAESGLQSHPEIAASKVILKVVWGIFCLAMPL